MVGWDSEKEAVSSGRLTQYEVDLLLTDTHEEDVDKKRRYSNRIFEVLKGIVVDSEKGYNLRNDLPLLARNIISGVSIMANVLDIDSEELFHEIRTQIEDDYL